ncbi:hypothetical protein H8A97_10110 [Bradyrhizobium sp. Arg62]|uniref:hypothetical protein n=1 Tax=Bradyrhizobium brasilense TaxID=1419277 RepID=UPI001E653F57|nr:hypothetical protein [Bradyrhizobium brasilense]MCC8945444.1 hypothetical protein [Bradyrhizobium brasilense]
MEVITWLGGLVSWTTVSWLLGLVPIGAAWKWWSDRRNALIAEAGGSHVTIKSGVQDLGEPPAYRVRWVAIRVKNWVDVPLHIQDIRLTWPPFVYAVRQIELVNDPTQDFTRKFKVNADLTEKSTLPETLLVSVNWLLKRLPSFMSRLHFKVTAETIDARRRRVSIILRSNQVDWSQPPQK